MAQGLCVKKAGNAHFMIKSPGMLLHTCSWPWLNYLKHVCKYQGIGIDGESCVEGLFFPEGDELKAYFCGL